MQREWEFNVLLKHRRGHLHSEHRKSWKFPLSKQFQLEIDILNQFCFKVLLYFQELLNPNYAL